MINSKENENKKFITWTAGAGLQTRANHFQSNYLKHKNLHFFSERLEKANCGCIPSGKTDKSLYRTCGIIEKYSHRIARIKRIEIRTIRLIRLPQGGTTVSGMKKTRMTRNNAG